MDTRDIQRETSWSPLTLSEWRETQETLHMWMQIVGKVKLELTPFLNQWWNIGFTLTPRGISSGLIPAEPVAFSVDFDFIDHTLYIRTSDGRTGSMPLISRSVADFYAAFLGALLRLGISVAIWPVPVEIPDPIPFDQDHVHASYEPEPVRCWWETMVRTERVMDRFRSTFIGKSSPVLFFWGSFDLTTTRFSGRPTDPPKPSAPRFLQIAEVQEHAGFGFWPGNATPDGVTLGEPAFYACALPQPPGFKDAPIQPEGTRYSSELGEFIPPHKDARNASNPDDAILSFFESAYDAVTTLGDWTRARLERTVMHA